VKRIYSYLAALLMISLMASQVHAKEQITQSDISGSAKEKCVSSEQTNDKIEADLQRHLERMRTEDIAKGYLREEETYAQELSLIRGRLYHSTDKLIHDEKKTTLLSYPVGSKVPCKKNLNDIDSYTDIITRKGMTFRIPKGAELKMFYMLDNNIFIEYEIGDIWYSIQIIPLDVDHPDSTDIENKVINFVGNAEERIIEDPLRILRAFRFMSRLGFSLSENTIEAIKKQKNLLTSIPEERITMEFSKLLLGENIKNTLTSMKDTGVLELIIPEFKATYDFEQHNPHHNLDLFNHIISVVSKVPADLELRYTALLHDIAKPLVQTFD